MNEKFKLTVHFDEKGEEIENLISRILINLIEHRKEEKCLIK